MNLSTKQIEKRRVVDKVQRTLQVWGEMEWEFGVSRSELLCAEWINKVLLYSTGNYIHYPVINHNGKQFSKSVYLCITESLCCTAELTQHCKSIILQ